MNTEELSYGYIIVNVSTARGAIPIEGAQVSIFSGQDSELLYVLETGRSGNTERVALAAPERENSLNPGIVPPYANYNLNVNKEGYFKNEYSSVAIFEGVTTIQNATLIPLPGYRDYPYDDSIGFDDSENPNLAPE